jgi:hypothetical protein
MDTFLGKPFLLSELREAIYELLAARSRGRGGNTVGFSASTSRELNVSTPMDDMEASVSIPMDDIEASASPTMEAGLMQLLDDQQTPRLTFKPRAVEELELTNMS